MNEDCRGGGYGMMEVRRGNDSRTGVLLSERKDTMKQFTRFAALLLVGALALALLTGCDGTAALNEKEIGKYIENMPSIKLESVNRTGPDSYVTLKATDEKDAVKFANAMRASIENPENVGEKPIDLIGNKWEDWDGLLVDNGKEEFVGLTYVKLPEFKKGLKETYKSSWVAYKLLEEIYIASGWDAIDASEGTISLKIETIDKDTYVFAVIRTPGYEYIPEGGGGIL